MRKALIATLIFAAAEASAQPPEERGVALGLFSQDPHYSYRLLLEEIRGTGATHVTIAWVHWQQTIRSSEIERVPGWSATQEQILGALKAAKRLGFHVTAFPIVRIVHSRPNEWRGRIDPKNEERWWESYTAYILRAADLAKRARADRLSIGSELLSREADRGRWKALIDRLRMATPELELMYSANWDHFEPVSFWDLVDVVGLTAYWELTRDMDASTDDLVLAWESIKPEVLDFARRLDRRIVFTEVGYPSLDGGAAWPWNETRKAPVDQEEQRRAYEAFVRVWSSTPALQGVYFWNWFGFGGPKDTNYTPRKKPAAEVIRDWYGVGK